MNHEQEIVSAIKDALGLSASKLSSHARYNLEGVLADMGRTDDVCRRTLIRVIRQLEEVERILRLVETPT